MCRWTRLLAGLPLLAALSAPAWAGRLDDTLADQLRPLSPTDPVRALVVMDEQFPFEETSARLRSQGWGLDAVYTEVVGGLKQVAATTQADLLDLLAAERAKGRVKEVRSLFVANMVVVEAQRALIEQLASRTDVGTIYPDFPVELVQPIITPAKPGEDAPREGRTLGNGLAVIEADRVWHELGVTGAGALVCNIDTGVDGNHSALSARWRGNHAPAAECFYDPVNNQSFPYDSGAHGTHTMGTITGMSPVTGDTVGVAFGAEWIAAATIDHPGGGGIEGTISLTLGSFQWALDPDGDEFTTDDVPDVISNSWGIPLGYRPACDATFYAAIDACEAAGIVVVFAAGNEGFSGLRTPPDRADSEYQSFAVAALDVSDPMNPFVAGFSSRGPSPCSADPSLMIKPDIAAPGVNIYSSVPGGGYDGGWSGTSMACPHIAGVVALMRSANPNLDPTTIKQIIYDTATDLDVAGNDNNVGHGMVNAYEAVLMSMTGYGTVTGVVSDATTSLPIAGARVTETADGRTTTTNALGVYSLSLPGDLTYNFEFSAFGYQDASASVAVIIDETVTLNAAMTPSAPGTLAGTVWDTHGNTVAGATISVPGTPVVPVTSGPGGAYSIVVPGNAAYDFQATAPGLGSVLDEDIYVAAGGTTSHDFFVPDDPIYSPTPPDAYGYVIYDMNDVGGPAYVWNSISGVGTPMSLSDDSYATVAVPFSYGFYGTSYSSLSVGSNGYVTPGDFGFSSYSNSSIPSADGMDGNVYLHWDDLNPGAGGAVYTYYDAAQHVFIVEWNAVPYFGGGGTVTMQCVLRDPAYYPTLTGDASFVCHFNQLGSTSSSTVGLENQSGTDGIQYAYNGDYHANASPITDEFSLLITTGFLSEDPTLVLMPSSVDLGVVYLNNAAPASYIIQNLSTAQLNVTSITPSSPQLVPAALSYSIAPAGSVTSGFTLTPTSLGTFNGTLTLASDDPTGPHVLTVTANVQNPPDVQVTPLSLASSLYTGDSEVQTLTISNQAANSTLDWTLTMEFDAQVALARHEPARGPGQVAPRPKLQGEEEGLLSRPAPRKEAPRPLRQEGADSDADRLGSPLQTLLDNLNAGYTDVTDLVPSRWDFDYDGWDGMSIGDGGLDMYDGGNYLNTDLGTSVTYSDNVVTAGAQFGGDYFTRHLPGLFVLVADLDGVSEFSITGNNGADGSGNVDGAVFTASVNGRNFTAFVKRVYNAWDPSINHIIVVESAVGLNHDYAFNTDDDYHRVTGLAGSERLYYGLVSSQSGGYIDDTAMTAILEQFMTTLGDAPAWLTFSPEGGALPGGDAIVVDATFNAAGLFGGVYTGTAIVASNDPVTPEVLIPVTLTVTGAANITVEPASLAYGDVFVGGSSVQNVTVSNTGTDLLTVSGLSIGNPGFSVSGAGFALAPGEEQVVPVTFLPTAVQAYAANLTIQSDDPDDPIVTVPLAGNGVAAPDIWVNPASITEVLPVDGTSVRTLTIGNSGGSTLTATLNLDNIVVPASLAQVEPNPAAPSTTDESVAPVASERNIQPGAERVVDVLVFRDNLAWGYNTLVPGFESQGAIVSVTGSYDMGVIDLSAYDLVVIESQQSNSFYQTLQSNRTWFESYLQGGGAMQIHVSAYSSDRVGGLLLPGGASLPASEDLDPNNYIADALHPIVDGLSDPFVGNYASHEHLVLPGGAHTIIENSSGQPTLAEYDFGAGHVLVNAMTWEWAVPNGYSAGNPFLPACAYMLGVASGPDWIALGSGSVTVPAGSSVAVDVLFDATGLAEGTYTADIVISSNDPLAPVTIVPATLIVGSSCAGAEITVTIDDATPWVVLGISGGTAGNTYLIYRSTDGYTFGGAPYASTAVMGGTQQWTDPQAPSGARFYQVVESCPDALAVTPDAGRTATIQVEAFDAR